MSSLPTLPQRSWLERVSLAVEFGLVACALLTLAGWLLHVDAFLQVPVLSRLSLATYKFNTALAVLALGTILIGYEFGIRRLAWLAVIPLTVGTVGVLQPALRIDLHVDELFARDFLAGTLTHAGRPAIVSSLCLIIGSVAVTLLALNGRDRLRFFTAAIIGSIIASAGFSTLVGYGAGLPAVYRWGTGVELSPMSAVSLILFGSAVISVAWRESMKLDHEAPAWSPLPVIIGCLTLTVVLWVGLRERETTYIGANTVTAMDRFVTIIRADLARQMTQFERMATSIANSGNLNAALWDVDAGVRWDGSATRGCHVIEYLDTAGRTQWVYPKQNNEGLVGFDHRTIPSRADAMLQARRIESPVVAWSTQVTSGAHPENGFVIYAPITRDHVLLGYVAAEFAYQPFFSSIGTAEHISDQYYVTASVADTTIYTSGVARPDLDATLTCRGTYPVTDSREQVSLRLQVSLTPQRESISRDRRHLPELAFLAGFGITALFGLSVHLARRARAGQRAAELSNKRLFAENEERRRIEARLKVSDERLRLALDSTQIGIFEWSVPAGHVYYSPGLWAMLGYDHTRMPSTAEAWQSLIHPDDLPTYRRRVEAQLAGAASFIDPEYRVRARNGDWRWVYSRSKAVAVGNDGRPTRIVGSIQDITARREAEFALRESQAEARKLSLVAAKTDNPVLITSPDGRIEWANEAFCRVMEYSLEEVVGKNPAHFMVGPETNPQTVGEIRAAMAQGDGISTDVVHYAKSGRKFHLHIEVQPVHSATGHLENFIAVETDITARVETEHQLRRAKAEADDASRAKSDFLASMSHEIRTPMNGVIGMTSLLMETVLTSEQRDYVNTIRTSGEALLTIINDILDFSKIESGKMELEHAPLELALCVEEALDLFALQAAAKKLELGYVMAADVPPWIVGDVTRLRQVIVNLVNNAVKFTPSGSVSLEIRRATRVPGARADNVAAPENRIFLAFTVRDTGIGIPADRLDRLFKAFSQIDSSTTRKYGGTGLGLAICQRLTELMGGEIRAESTTGQGSSFTFTIATEPAPAAPDAPTLVAPAALADRSVLCIEDNPVTQMRLAQIFQKLRVDARVVRDVPAALAEAARLEQPPALLVVDGGDVEGAVPLDALSAFSCPQLVLYPFGQTAPAGTPTGPLVASVSKPIRTAAFVHALTSLFQLPTTGQFAVTRLTERPIGEEIPLEVLLAEDNPVNQKVALRFLERLGYRADAVANGLEAVTAVENRRYDLVLMDLQMPEMDGFEATRQIRARVAPERQPRIVALTANAMQGDRELCVAAGMDDYISKPVKMHEIAAAIRRHFGRPQEISTERDRE